MTTTANGLAKLVEECGELQQVAGKALVRMGRESARPAGSLRTRLEEEMADMLAAADFVAETLALDQQGIRTRRDAKLDKFRQRLAGEPG
ncbi:MAG TPA: hypothetical protein VFA86_11855 [Gammaproteobacteria bacterium]|nr:hypothetical protein [Gammaproteobacteria bacterium]